MRVEEGVVEGRVARCAGEVVFCEGEIRDDEGEKEISHEEDKSRKEK